MADPKPYKCGNRYYLIDRSDLFIEKVRKTGGQIESWRFCALEWVLTESLCCWQPLKISLNDVINNYREIGWLEILVVTGETEESAQSIYREHFGSDE